MVFIDYNRYKVIQHVSLIVWSGNLLRLVPYAPIVTTVTSAVCLCSFKLMLTGSKLEVLCRGYLPGVWFSLSRVNASSES